MRLKRGQLSTTKLMWILGIVIVALMLLLGYKWVADLRESQNQAGMELLKVDLATDAKDISLKNGARSKKTYKVPSNINKICIVDVNLVDEIDLENEPIIRNSILDSVPDNVFFFGSTIGSIIVDNIEVPGFPYFYCTYTKGDMEVKLEGTGNKTIVYFPVIKEYCENAACPDPINDPTCAVNFCDGLDLLFGPWYRQECCSKYNKCC